MITRIKPFATQADIHDFLCAKPLQYLEKVGERGLKLSGGEKQRMAITRALLKQSKIMCFDEATSALDNETEAEVQKAIDDISHLSNRPTTLIIAHRLSTVRNCDTIIVMKDGTVEEQGTHEELISGHEGLYKKLWGF